MWKECQVYISRVCVSKSEVPATGCQPSCLSLATDRLTLPGSCKDQPSNSAWNETWDTYIPAMQFVVGFLVYQLSETNSFEVFFCLIFFFGREGAVWRGSKYWSILGVNSLLGCKKNSLAVGDGYLTHDICILIQHWILFEDLSSSWNLFIYWIPAGLHKLLGSEDTKGLMWYEPVLLPWFMTWSMPWKRMVASNSKMKAWNIWLPVQAPGVQAGPQKDVIWKTSGVTKSFGCIW